MVVTAPFILGAMMSRQKAYLSHRDVGILAIELGKRIRRFPHPRKNHEATFPIKLYGVPRGGVLALYALMCRVGFWVEVVEEPKDADVFIDDIIDSGATRDIYTTLYPGVPFMALVDKTGPAELLSDAWVVFPWERNEQQKEESPIADSTIRLLQYIGEDPAREGLTETPERVAKAWKYWTSGYTQDAGELLKVFEDGAQGCDEMIMVRDIPLYSKCEHHLADIFGAVTIAYIPNGKIVGLSKLNRLADMFARRLQVQERLTNQIADALHTNLAPLGVGVIIKARHMCMESRGVCQQGHMTITSALRGVIKTDNRARGEFLKLAE